jgi:hypothetical protein
MLMGVFFRVMAIPENAWPQSARHILNHKERRERKDEDMKDAKAILTNLYFHSLRSLRLRNSFYCLLGRQRFLKMLYVA